MVLELIDKGCDNIKSDYSIKIAQLTREVQLLTALVLSKDLELQTIPRLVEEASR